LDNVHSLQNALEANKIEKKEMYVFCFQRFVETLGAKITQQGPDFIQSSYWFWVSGFMKQTAREVFSFHLVSNRFRATQVYLGRYCILGPSGQGNS
jgi:hypothetical protein